MPIIDQIGLYQNSFSKIKANEKHSNDLADNVKGKLTQANISNNFLHNQS